MQAHHLGWQGQELHYLKGGSGARNLICLHGYGESAAHFAFLETYLGQEFTLYAIDLPWHGSTRWSNCLTFPVDALIDLLQRMIPGFKTASNTLLGYSMGGRVALTLLEQMPDAWERAVLLAPDGLKVNPWYWLATQTKLGNKLFRYTMQHPNGLLALVYTAQQLRLMKPSMGKFIHPYINNPAVRADLYRIWTTLRKFRPNLYQLGRRQQHSLPMHVLFGQYDRIVPPANGRALQRAAPGVRIHTLAAGHQLLREKHAPLIRSLLLD